MEVGIYLIFNRSNKLYITIRNRNNSVGLNDGREYWTNGLLGKVRELFGFGRIKRIMMKLILFERGNKVR